jgi:hypothetical protein
MAVSTVITWPMGLPHTVAQIIVWLDEGGPMPHVGSQHITNAASTCLEVMFVVGIEVLGPAIES